MKTLRSTLVAAGLSLFTLLFAVAVLSGTSIAESLDESPSVSPDPNTTATKRIWPFFAFDNGVGRGSWTPGQQADLLAELGYDGIGYTGVKNIPAVLEALETRGLTMFSTYVRLNLKRGEAAFDADLPTAIRQLAGHGTALWLHVHNDRAASPAEDERAVQLIRQVADMAHQSKLPVVLYPHVGLYVATMSDAVRLARQCDRPNVGASFNLCHFLKQNDAATLPDQLRAAMPYLRLVSINGADAGDTRAMSWDRLIQTLDRGSFDVQSTLKLLRELDYRGPIGLQCYAIPGDVRDNLARSIQAWNRIHATVAK
jgi:sugar phosphate isomerase/epimerase